LLLRQWFPVGQSFFGLQLGYFSSYLVLFFLGTVAWEHDWLAQLTWKQARPWLIVSVVLLPMMVITALLTGLLAGKPVNVNGGFSLPAVLYAFWEPFVAWGIIATYLVWFRDQANRPSAFWQYLGTRAYAVYILHAPILVGVSLELRPWHAPALMKFAVTGTLALMATVAASSLVLKIPGARRIL
jgi:peptidoglycan/LPS O-acetylase OafA/YrhL